MAAQLVTQNFSTEIFSKQIRPFFCDFKLVDTVKVIIVDEIAEIIIPTRVHRRVCNTLV